MKLSAVLQHTRYWGEVESTLWDLHGLAAVGGSTTMSYW